MKRRDFIKTGGALVASSLLSAPLTSYYKAQGETSMNKALPNVLFIFSDQQRHDTYGKQNRLHADTPSMNRLAETGVQFRQAFCTCPQCSPSRATLQTGLYPTQAQMVGNLGNPSDPMPTSLETIGHRMQKRGYQTAYMGKWHLGGNIADYGYDYAMKSKGDQLAVQEACSYLASMTDPRPLLQIVSFIDPHDIYKLNKDPNAERPPAKEAWPSQSDTLDTKPWPQRHFRDFDQGKPLKDFGDEDWEYYRRFYASKVEKVDGYLGQILDALNQSGRLDNTWIFFTSDHGDLCGAHCLPFKCPAMYDDLARIPLIIVPPKGGSFDPCDVMTNNIDIVPTIMSIAGIPEEPSLPGQSLLPLITGKGKYVKNEAIYSQYHQKQRWTAPIRMIRTEKWKYNIYIKHGTELYDLESDPHEMHNLADDPDYREIRDELHKRLVAHIDSIGDPFFTFKATDRSGKEL